MGSRGRFNILKEVKNLEETLNKPLIVWTGLTTLINESLKHMAALNVLNEKLEQKENRFLRIIYETTSCYILLEIAKIFDKANFGESSNCSMNKIRELCLKDSKKFPKGTEDTLILKIDVLKNKCEATVPMDIRNKKLAHNDLEEMFLGHETIVDATEIQDILKNLAEIIAEVSERLIGAKLKLETIEKYMDIYREEFDNLQTKNGTAD